MDWFGSVPSRWEQRKIKYLFSERVQKGHPNEPLLVASQNMGVVPKDVYGNRTVEATKDLHLLKLVEIGDFVISLRSFQGGIEYAYNRGIISPAYTIMIPLSDITAGYFRFLAKSARFIELLKNMVTGIREGQNINYEKLKNERIPLPPRAEQDQIVRYLDWKVSQINKLINAKRRQIELLREQKQNRINDIVLHGIDPVCKMKESGIEYIGTVPEHWLVLLNHRIFISVNRKFDEQETVLSLSQKDGLIPYEIMTERSLHTASYDNWQLVLENDLVLNRFKAHLGVFFASHYRGIVTFHYGVYSSRIPLVAKYYEALYHTPIYRRVYAGQSRGMTVGLQNLSDTNFFNTYTLYPPFEEQSLIVTEIEKIESQYVSIEKKIMMSIDSLQELRTRLISDVVTGQIDVRNVVIPEYKPVEEDTSEVEFADDELGISEAEEP